MFFPVFQSDTHLPSKFMRIYKGKKNLFDDALMVTFFFLYNQIQGERDWFKHQKDSLDINYIAHGIYNFGASSCASCKMVFWRKARV